MKPVTITVGSATVSVPVPVDYLLNPFSIGLGCVVSAGGVLTYKVQHSFDNPFAAAYDPATATWFDHATITGKTANQDGNYAFPVRAVRLNVTAYTGGNVTMTLVQSGVGL